MAEYPRFIGPTYQTASRVVGVERCINWYPEMSESPGAKVPLSLLPAPGLRPFVTLPLSPGRGLASADNRLFAVGGGGFYEVLGNGTTVLRGTVVADDQPCTIHTNGDLGRELFLCSGGFGYLYHLDTHAFSTVLTGDARFGDYLDGYFLALDPATSTLRLSDLADGGTWSALQLQQRNAAPDKWVRVIVSNRDVLLLGTDTAEVWQDYGTSPFPLQPVPGATLEFGTCAPWSAVVLGAPIWLGQSRDGRGMVLQLNGYTAQRVSTHGIEQLILEAGERTRIDDAEGWGYQEGGHTFYVLTFPTAQLTVAYDLNTRQWHERGDLLGRTGQIGAYRPRQHALWNGRHYVIDRDSGVIATLDAAYGYDIDGTPIRRLRRAPHLSAGRDRFRVTVHRFGLDLEGGRGATTGQGVDPLVMLRLSKDGGLTWGYEKTRSAGAQGAYTVHPEWHALGAGIDPVIEIAVSDPIPWRITGASIDVTVGSA